MVFRRKKVTYSRKSYAKGVSSSRPISLPKELGTFDNESKMIKIEKTGRYVPSVASSNGYEVVRMYNSENLGNVADTANSFFLVN